MSKFNNVVKNGRIPTTSEGMMFVLMHLIKARDGYVNKLKVPSLEELLETETTTIERFVVLEDCYFNAKKWLTPRQKDPQVIYLKKGSWIFIRHDKKRNKVDIEYRNWVNIETSSLAPWILHKLNMNLRLLPERKKGSLEDNVAYLTDFYKRKEGYEWIQKYNQLYLVKQKRLEKKQQKS